MKRLMFCVNQDILKIIAFSTMIVDHVSKYFLSGFFRDFGYSIGRMSFPIFSFLLMEHLSKKKIFKKYIIRLGCFGLLTFFLLFPFHFFLKQNLAIPLNILISFLIAILLLGSFEWIEKGNWLFLVKTSMYAVCVLFFSLLALYCQYNIMGLYYLSFIYFYFKKPSWLNLFFVLLFSILINFDGEMWIISFLTTFALLCLNWQKPGLRLIKDWRLFYVLYPVHLFLISVILIIKQKGF